MWSWIDDYLKYVIVDNIQTWVWFADPQISTDCNLRYLFFFIFGNKSNWHHKMVHLHMPNQCKNKEDKGFRQWIRFFSWKLKTKRSVLFSAKMFKSKIVMGQCNTSLNAKIYFHFILLHFTFRTKCVKSFPWLHFYLQIANKVLELKYLNVFKKQCFMVHISFKKVDS